MKNVEYRSLAHHQGLPELSQLLTELSNGLGYPPSVTGAHVRGIPHLRLKDVEWKNWSSVGR
jgi:hypothetical protein